MHFLFDEGAVLAEELDLVIEFGQFVEDLVLVLLVDLAQVDYSMRSVLS